MAVPRCRLYASCMDDGRAAPLPRGLGEALVFLSSGAVLVLEILSLRLVAPYAGLTLQVSTAVIGSALAAIAAGAWLGGRLADVTNPRTALGPSLAVSGVTTLGVLPLVRWAGIALQGHGPLAVLLLAMSAIFLPAALLSALSPLVVKLQLATLARTGSVVGRYSALGTLGAIVASFLTGFVLVAHFATSALLTTLGVSLLVLGGVTHFWVGTRRWRGRPGGVTAVAVLLAVPSLFLPLPPACEVETLYSCASVKPDPERESGRYLIVNNGMQSYVDLEDPTYLRFEYTKVFAAVVGAARAALDRPVRVLHIGGGASTVPRYVEETDPGSQNTVFEIDQGLIDLSARRMGLRAGGKLRVVAADARLAIRAEPADSFDVVVGDAFGNGTPPWHLTTVEALRDIDRVLVPGGVYVVNVIDFPPFDFLGAKVATLQEVFEEVTLLARPEVIRGQTGGNVVLVASHQPPSHADLQVTLQSLASKMVPADAPFLGRLPRDAPVLTDDFAPVDQLVNLPTQRILGDRPGS